MPVYNIANIPVSFPFEPYDVQKAFMEKVILCLNEGTNGVLESPTGTGKTLNLLCSSLAWVTHYKAQMQFHEQADMKTESKNSQSSQSKTAPNWGVPKIIYASRTHSQLTQAMQEMKRTSYNNMRAVVLGSRDQLCINPEVMAESSNSEKIHLCKIRVESRTCSFYSRVESKKDHPDFRNQGIMDVEDLVTVGRKLKMCPYYSSKELVKEADITFMPYNYLLDPKARKANKVELNNTIVILDEAHNVEKLCEESASVQICSSDVALVITELKHIIKSLQNQEQLELSDEPKDFTIDDVLLLAEMADALEKAIDEVVVDNIVEGTTYPAGHMFEILAKANITSKTFPMVTSLIDKLIQFLAVGSQSSQFSRGRCFQTLADLLVIVFVNKEEDFSKVFRSFKMHVQIEEVKTKNPSNTAKGDGWFTTRGNEATLKKVGRIINYWCFNPGFGMEQLLNKNVRSVILTSGTLAPLTPLIAELSIPIAHRLENPHIVSKSQVFVKIISAGPDREQLVSNFQNRDNPKYINSLGRTILALCPIIPDGLLVFFPSYPMMNKCVDHWQASGIWTQITRLKPITIEPRNKESFNTAMTEFYEKIRSPNTKGACFMAVCRGKVSEGLDFADRNGRAVIITGLPFPPLKDPRVILKKRYLDENRSKENELLTGNAWYSLEATRAVNQAIGRVIRHKNDYGAIILCDARFSQQNQISQLSAWLREHLRTSQNQNSFGPIIGDLSKFFKNAERTIPKPSERFVETSLSQSSHDDDFVDTKDTYKRDNENKKKFNKVIEATKRVQNTNSYVGWSPDEYASAAGRPKSEKMPTAMDFMSRLDSDVSTIDFNECNQSKEKTNSNSFNTCERSSLNCSTASPNLHGTCGSEQMKRKRYKLAENNCSFSGSSYSGASSSQLSNFDFNKSRVIHESDQSRVPEDRIEFLKLIKRSLSSDKYTLYVNALTSYKETDNIANLLATLKGVFDHACLHYLLKGMRRFVRDRHKAIFDETIQKNCK